MATVSGFVRQALARLTRDRSGAVAVMTALSLTALLGVAGLGTEASLWYVTKRTMQGAADSAAYSAAVGAAAGQSSTNAKAEAQAVTAQYGYVNGGNNVIVTVNNPPLSGSHTSDTSAYEVIVSQPQPRFISALFLSSNATISGRAVATQATSGAGNGCVLALDKGAVVDVSDTGGATLNINNCSLYVNSDDPRGALTMSGGSIINAWSAYIVGKPAISGGAALNTTHGVFTGTSAIADPYAGTPVPALGSCAGGYTTYPSIAGGTTIALTAGTYCGGLNVSGGSTVNLSPGTYVMNGGSFSIAGGSTIACPTCSGGSGVTIVLTGSGSNYATVNIAGGANVSLTAPNSGTYSGLAFFQDPKAPTTGTDSFSGGSTQNINGAIYFPDQTVAFAGGSSVAGAQCTQLVANEIQISGGTSLSSNCSSSGTKTIGGSTATQLVE